jgi:hypothetical protein
MRLQAEFIQTESYRAQCGSNQFTSIDATTQRIGQRMRTTMLFEKCILECKKQHTVWLLQSYLCKTFMCIYIYISVCVCLYVCMCVYVCMHACMQAYVCMYVCMYACMHVCMYACMHVCMYACMYVCMYVHPFKYLQCIYIYYHY